MSGRSTRSRSGQHGLCELESSTGIALNGEGHHSYFICPAYPYFDPAYRDFEERP